VLRHQVLIKNLAYTLEELVQEHDVSELHFDVEALDQERHVLEVENVGQVVSHRHSQLEDILRHDQVPILPFHSLGLLDDGSEVSGHQNDRVDGVLLALIVNLDTFHVEGYRGLLLRLGQQQNDI